MALFSQSYATQGLVDQLVQVCQVEFPCIINSESLDFPCSYAALLAELTEYFFTKICAVMGEGGHLQQRG